MSSTHLKNYTKRLCHILNFHFRPMIEMCIPSSLDRTIAPEGCHVISLFTQYTPYTLKGREWDDATKNLYADRGKEIQFVSGTNITLNICHLILTRVPIMKIIKFN